MDNPPAQGQFRGLKVRSAAERSIYRTGRFKQPETESNIRPLRICCSCETLPPCTAMFAGDEYRGAFARTLNDAGFA